jgi:hypothetical protein|tara:strand:- start:5677 stop:6060 length:384 start_codon:yes stop_codon:yes gene_type:complete
MKKLLLLLLCIVLAYTATAQDTISIPQSELEEFFYALDTLEQQDSIRSILIKDLEFQITNYKTLANQDSTLLLYHRKEIGLLNNQIKLYDHRLKVVDKWYNKRWVGTLIGVVGTIAIVHVIDYSLPQ